MNKALLTPLKALGSQILELIDLRKGGAGSGNFNHAGCPGKVGGSCKPGGGSTGKSQYLFLGGPDGRDAFLELSNRMLGAKSPEDFLRMMGVPDGSTCEIWKAGTGILALEYKNPELGIKIASRTIREDKDGKLSCTNIQFYLNPGAQGKGLGSQIFYDQVQGLAAAGVARIKTTAVRSDDENGYYTWPRLGYDGPTAPWSVGKGQMLSELMADPKGRELWKKSGKDINLEFDLTEGSRSRKVLDAYMKEKGHG